MRSNGICSIIVQWFEMSFNICTIKKHQFSPQFHHGIVMYLKICIVSDDVTIILLTEKHFKPEQQ